jgi:hypothetical protein
MTTERRRKYFRNPEDIVPGAWTDPWTPTEAEFTRLVLQVARAKGWARRYHTHDSRRSSKGFPDWVMVNVAQKRILFLELKGWGARKPSDEQLEWLADLAACGAEAYLVSTTKDKAHDMAALAEMFDPPRSRWAA